jgi:G3E family GTPase
LIPVSVVTGFLGSGKTTLIARTLRDPGFARTAVIVSEFGEIGLDHDLIASSDDQVVTLNTGCLCCVVQTDLARTLMALLTRREAGSADYDRVLIETSGLSDPAPVLQGMMTDAGVAAVYDAPYVLTVVDTMFGETSLAEHAEARHQVAVADCVLLSKTDVRPASPGLIALLDGLNGAVQRMTTMQAEAARLFGEASAAAIGQRLAQTPRLGGHSDIDTVTLVRERPIPALALTMLLQAVAEHCGRRLLRMKGLVSIAEMPGQPAVIHGVRHVVSAPEFLPRWPSADERTRIVLITSGVPRHFVARLLDAIEEEVREALSA